MKPVCIIKNCQNNSLSAPPPATNSEFAYHCHRFPKNEEQISIWYEFVHKCNQNYWHNKKWRPKSASSTICSDHFEKSCFVRHGRFMVLRRGSNPTLIEPRLGQTATDPPNEMEIPQEDELAEHILPDDLMGKDLQSLEFLVSPVDDPAIVDFAVVGNDGQNAHYQCPSQLQPADVLQIMSSCLLCHNDYNIHALQNLTEHNVLSKWKIQQFLINEIKACAIVRKNSKLVRYISDGIDKTKEEGEGTGEGEPELPFCHPCFLKLSNMQRFSDKTRLMQQKLNDLKEKLIQEFQNACSRAAAASASASNGFVGVDIKTECFKERSEPEAMETDYFIEDDLQFFEEAEDSYDESAAARDLGIIKVPSSRSSVLGVNARSQPKTNILGIIKPCSVVLERLIMSTNTASIVTPAKNYYHLKAVNKPPQRKTSKKPHVARHRKIKRSTTAKVPRHANKSLRRHRRSGFKKYKCRVCLKILVETESGRMTKSRHEADHFLGDRKYYNCHLCPRRFHFRGNFIKHLSQGHGDNTHLANGGSIIFYYCDGKSCEQCFASQSLLETHILSEHHPSSWTCASCGRMFAQEENFKTHQLEIHENQNSSKMTIMRSCEYCHLSFDTAEDLTFHKGIHEISLKTIAEHICDECGSSFVSARKLSYHVRKQHRRRANPNPEFDAISFVTRTEQTVKAQQKGNFSFVACGECGKTFSTAHRLNAHSYEHMTNHPGFPCPECDQIFKSPIQLSRHRTNSHRKVRCEYCQKGMWSIVSLPHHLFKHHRDAYLAEKPFLCEVCFKNFATTEELTTHSQTHENAMCKICNLQCANLRGLKIHQRAHYVSRVELPPQSSNEQEQETTTTSTESGGNSGESAKLANQSVPPICLVCHEDFQTETQLKDHYFTKHENIVLKGGEKKDFICPRPTVQVSWKRIGALGPHKIREIQQRMNIKRKRIMRNTTCSPSSSSYTCETCGKPYSTALTLRNHELTHLAKDERNQRESICHICGKSYLNSQTFYIHMKSHQHQAADPTKSRTSTRCLYCSEAFRDMVVRRRHQIRAHSEQALATQPFYCEICFFQFSTEEELNNHSSTKHYKCQQCGKNFLTNLKLSEHENSHTGNKPYSCQICGNCFTSHSNLHMHKKMHGSEGKQFQCVQCSNVGKDTRFYAQCELNKHVKRCHPIIGEDD